MEAKDLRIGNYVQGTPISCPRLDYHSDGKTMVTSYGIHLIDTNQWTVEPIPLTEELLLMFGFECIDKGTDNEFFCIGYKGEDDISAYSCDFEVNKNDDGSWHVELYSIEVNHLHTLQNVFFAITGTELELK